MLNYLYFITKSCHSYLIKISSFATSIPDISSCNKHCNEMVDGVKMNTNILRTIHSVKLAYAQDMID